MPVAQPAARSSSHREQAAAIAARERDAFLEAGAGTGKTTVLVDRYCEAVAEDGVEVDRHPRLHLHRARGGRDAHADPRASSVAAPAPPARRGDADCAPTELLGARRGRPSAPG